MRVLLLGNSFTYYHDMPLILKEISGFEVVSHTRPGGYLYEHLDPKEEMGAKTLAALKNEKWDYVILQEQSFCPVGDKKCFDDSVDQLCKLIKENGAKPLLYATWAYEEGTAKLNDTGLSYDELSKGLYDAYHGAALRNGAGVIDVGLAFDRMRKLIHLYEDDNYHPSEAASMYIAQLIKEAIEL